MAEAPGGLSLREAWTRIGEIIWPDAPSERRDFEDFRETLVGWDSEDDMSKGKRLGETVALRASSNVAGLRDLVVAPDPTRRALVALEQLAHLAIDGEPGADEALTEALRNPEPRIRAEAVQLIGYVRFQKSLTPPGSYLGAPDDWLGMRREPLLGLGISFPGIPSNVRFEDEPLKVNTDQAANPFTPGNGIGGGAIASLPFQDVFRVAITDPDPRVRCAGLRFGLITEVETGEGRSRLVDASINDPDPRVQQFALTVLKRAGDPGAGQAAISAFLRTLDAAEDGD